MPTTPHITAAMLRELHRLHRQLTDLSEQLERGPKQIKAREANVAHQEQVVAQAQAEAKAFRVATDGNQLLLKSKEQKVKELKVKLNQATSNREYQALKEQIAADEMANSVLADEILEAMDKMDGHQQLVAEAQATLAKSREEAERVKSEVAEREPLLRGDVERLTAELEVSETNLPHEIRDWYQRSIRQRGEDSLAAMTGDYCSGCNQQVPVNLINSLRLNRPVFCKSCGRLLYLPESQE
jgi:uncharacterized protein